MVRMGFTFDENGKFSFEGSTNRSELAARYGMSEKRFRKELKRAGIELGDGRVLIYKHVKEIVDKLGPFRGHIEP
jgi:hypothetical protein